MVTVIQVSVIAILIAVGYFLAKKQIFTPVTGKELSWLLINIVTPALILNSFQLEYTPEKLGSLLTTFFLGFLSYAVVIAFSFLYCGRGEEHKVERLSIIFSNAGFMGIPLIEGIFGTEGVFYAAIFGAIFNIVFWTYGIAAVRGQFSLKSLKTILLSPTILAVAVGLVLFVEQIRLPEPIASVTRHLSNLNTPLAMMIAGISIAQSDLGAVFRKLRLYKILAGKLFLAPMLVAAVFLLLPGSGFIKEIIVLQTACPVAAIIGISILQQGGDNRSATEYFTLTTLSSMVTLPLIKLFCGWLF